jgi:hypothetical protein
MTTIVNRGSNVQPTQSIQLTAKFYKNGVLADLDSFPQISIIQPNGMVVISNSSIGVFRLSVGIYSFLFEVPFTTSLGVWVDHWVGQMSGQNIVQEFNFIVELSQMPAVNTDGYVALGDQPSFAYSQIAIQNINMLMLAVKTRLSSSGLAKTTDASGNVTYQNCDIFSVEQLTVFIAGALSAFNQIPTFTAFTFESTEILTIFFEVIVQHAVIWALASKQMVEKGREFTITDNGVAWSPPGVSEVLGSQFNAELGNWYDKVKLIKQNMKSSPLAISLGSAMGSPRLRILRNLRSRQIY